MKIHNRPRDWIKILLAPAVVMWFLDFVARIDTKEEFQYLLVQDFIPGALVGLVVLVCAWPTESTRLEDKSKRRVVALLRGLTIWLSLAITMIAWHCLHLILRGGIPRDWWPI